MNELSEVLSITKSFPLLILWTMLSKKILLIAPNNFFDWIKGAEIVELQTCNVDEDPVRPELDIKFRTEYGRKIYGVKYKKEICAVMCFGFTNDIPKTIEELTAETCRWPIGHPYEEKFYFCGRKPESDFPYCKLHVLYAFQPKNQKEDDLGDEIPEFIEKKIKSAS